MERPTKEETIKGMLNRVNILFQAAHQNCATGLLPEAAEMQRAGLQRMAQEIVDYLQSLLPIPDDVTLVEPTPETPEQPVKRKKNG